LPDLPGSGRSETPRGSNSIEGMADALWQLIDSEAGASTSIIGFSLGGAVALEMALQRPQQVERLVLINSLPSYRVDHWRKWLELYLQIAAVRLFGLPRAARMVAARMFPLGSAINRSAPVWPAPRHWPAGAPRAGSIA
jgi:pimeloyl-ACP methyl ester carboxylesterase